VIKGEIRIGDRAYLYPDRIAVVRANGDPIDLMAELRKARVRGLINRNHDTFRLFLVLPAAQSYPVFAQRFALLLIGQFEMTKAFIRLIESG